jgi:hypothetical protein
MSRLMATARGKRRSSAWERSLKKAAMDPSKAEEVKSGAAGPPGKRGRELGEREARASVLEKKSCTREKEGRRVAAAE